MLFDCSKRMFFGQWMRERDESEEMSFGRNERLRMLLYGLGFVYFELNGIKNHECGESWKTRCDDFEKHEISLLLILVANQF